MSDYSRDSLIYLAAFIDGEGHIALYYSPNKVIATFNIQFSVTNTNKMIIDWIIQTFKAVRRNHVKYDGRKQVNIAAWNRDEAKIILREILPFLKIKIRQAEVLLEYLNTVYISNGRLKCLTAEQGFYFKVLADECSELNKRG